MNKLEELKHNVEALLHAVKEDKKFFSSIYSFVEKLYTLLTSSVAEAKKEEIIFLAEKIESFFAKYRLSNRSSFIPPVQAVMNDNTVKDIYRLSRELSTISEEEFNSLKPLTVDTSKTSRKQNNEQCIFIGHGRSKLWATVKMFLSDECKLKTVFYEAESRVGESIVPILEKMLNEATFAILVLTAEDLTDAGEKRARQNVVHEAGLFQGRLGFKKAILLVQRGIEGFSNIDGLQYIPFTEDSIEETFYELQRTLKAQGIIK